MERAFWVLDSWGQEPVMSPEFQVSGVCEQQGVGASLRTGRPGKVWT